MPCSLFLQIIDNDIFFIESVTSIMEVVTSVVRF
jgi:hypothetical protein